MNDFSLMLSQVTDTDTSQRVWFVDPNLAFILVWIEITSLNHQRIIRKHKCKLRL